MLLVGNREGPRAVSAHANHQPGLAIELELDACFEGLPDTRPAELVDFL